MNRPKNSDRSNGSVPIAVRTLELSEPWNPIEDVREFLRVKVFGLWRGVAICSVEIDNHCEAISVAQLESVLAAQSIAPYDPGQNASDPSHESLRQPLDPEIAVSIVIATCDRPVDLARCLTHLLAQKTSRQWDIWVVDNRPDSGLTPPVVEQAQIEQAKIEQAKIEQAKIEQARSVNSADRDSADRNFALPKLHYLAERRRGGSAARNAGFAASAGTIVVIVDDDVSVPPDWLERLLAPLSRPEVAMVTGNLLPLTLEARSQQIFECYCNGGLSRGFVSFEVDGAWFRDRRLAVPTWELGATANLAFRRSLLSDPRVGDLDPVLSPGLPTGGGEDLYWFYCILKANYRIVYEPRAWAWHRHRSSMAALKHQIYSYGKGNIGYHLTTFTRHQDWRVLPTVLIFLPIYFFKRCVSWLKGQRDYPLHLTFLEIAGMLAGPWSWWRARREGRRGRGEVRMKNEE